MKYLLDTNVFLWGLTSFRKLNTDVQELLAHEQEGLYLSSASCWEIAIKYGLGKLTLPQRAAEYVTSRMKMWAIRPLEITHSHALAVGDLPPLHSDPFDRILVAQARLEEMVLVTGDAMIRKYDVELLWSLK